MTVRYVRESHGVDLSTQLANALDKRVTKEVQIKGSKACNKEESHLGDLRLSEQRDRMRWQFQYSRDPTGLEKAGIIAVMLVIQRGLDASFSI